MNNSPIGSSWDEYKKTKMTPEYRAKLKLKTDIICEIIEARRDKKVTQTDLSKLSGVRQPVIARIETDVTDPRISTVLKILNAIGKTLKVVDIEEAEVSVDIKEADASAETAKLTNLAANIIRAVHPVVFAEEIKPKRASSRIIAYKQKRVKTFTRSQTIDIETKNTKYTSKNH